MFPPTRDIKLTHPVQFESSVLITKNMKLKLAYINYECADDQFEIQTFCLTFALTGVHFRD